MPPLQTTSYDYWWPYPAAVDTPTPTATATSDTNLDGDTNAESGTSSSIVPTASVFQITALPPAMTSIQPVLPKLAYHREVNILYLVPLFIALGVTLGAITAVIVLKWRRRLPRTSSLLPGPPYVPPEDDVEDLPIHASMEQVSLLAVSTPSKYTIHGSRYTPKQIPAWKTLDTTRSSFSQSTYVHTIIPSSDGERFTVLTQEDPFHVPPNVTTARQSPTPSNDVLFPTIRIIPSLPTPISGDNVTHHQDTSLPKPFRRSMFDILKLKGPRAMPSTHKTFVSDDDAGSTSRVRRVTSLKGTPPLGRSRFRGARRSLDGGSIVGNMGDALGLSGAHDVIADSGRPRTLPPFAAESSSSQEEGIHRGRNEIDEDIHSDIFTKAPRRRHSRMLSKKASSAVSRCSSTPDMHASILPLSPPLLMSPPLERSLFFTTALSSSASLAARMNSLVTLDTSLCLVGKSPMTSPTLTSSKKTKETRTLRTSAPGSPLPYPSYPDPGHVQPTTARPSPSQKGRLTTTTHRESITGISSLGSLSPTSLAIALAASSSSDMLSKVNDIVAQGYIRRRSSVVGSERVGTSDSI